MSGKRKYSDEFRLQVVKDYLSSEFGGYRSLANKYGVNHQLIERWVRLYELHGAEGLCKT